MRLQPRELHISLPYVVGALRAHLSQQRLRSRQLLPQRPRRSFGYVRCAVGGAGGCLAESELPGQVFVLGCQAVDLCGAAGGVCAQGAEGQGDGFLVVLVALHRFDYQ